LTTDHTATKEPAPRPTLCVVTPSFNQADYLETTILSVISQRFAGLEYVVVDGNSSDESVSIIRRYERDLAWWVSEPDAGYADAINKGFSHTSAPIMGWINSSDLLLPWSLTVVAEVFAENPDVQWITGAPCMAGSDGIVRSTIFSQVNRYDLLSGQGSRIQQESTFWRRELWDAVGGLDPSLRYAADFDLWARFFERAELHTVTCALAAFRVHDERLGAPRPDGYRAEVKASLARMAGKAGRRDLRRAALVGFARKRGGHLGSSLVEAFALSDWYRHPRISYDFSEGRWKAHRQRRIGERRPVDPTAHV
jgi:glycosyltransferase involved in cell wall biosynthesis